MPKIHVSTTVNTNVEVDVDEEVNVSVKNIAASLSNKDMIELVDIFNKRGLPSPMIKTTNLEDEFKFEVLKKAMNKYSLEELEQRLDMNFI